MHLFLLIDWIVQPFTNAINRPGQEIGEWTSTTSASNLKVLLPLYFNWISFVSSMSASSRLFSFLRFVLLLYFILLHTSSSPFMPHLFWFFHAFFVTLSFLPRVFFPLILSTLLHYHIIFSFYVFFFTAFFILQSFLLLYYDLVWTKNEREFPHFHSFFLPFLYFSFILFSFFYIFH